MKILILEHSPMARRLISQEFLASDYQILEAETVDQALDILASEPGISLLTTGVALDGGDGFDFIRDLRSPETVARLKPVGNQGVPAILVTSNDTDEDRLRGYKVGAADFIQKPWEQGQLLSHVNSVLGQDDELAGMTVLVADDSPTARTFITNCIERLGVNILQADDGDTALEILKKTKVDLLVTDLHMVRMDGDALCLKIRGELGMKNLPVIFLSANDEKGAIISLFKLGATDYLRKPFLQEELMARLRVHLERQKLMQVLNENSRMATVKVAQSQDLGTVEENGKDRPLRILLVDDGPVNLVMGTKILQHLGCQVEAVDSGSYAVSRFEAQLVDEPFDLVLMDLMMPEVSGLEATRRIRAIEKDLPTDYHVRRNPVPIIALTASSKADTEGNCLEAGMSDFQTKPMQIPAIQEILKRWK
jgi:CheY-like chemotaxis protein